MNDPVLLYIFFMFPTWKKNEQWDNIVKIKKTLQYYIFTGTRTFQHCKKYVKDVILVSDQELLDTMQQFYKRGLVVEPSGCAAMAALLGGHVPDIEGKKIVVFVTGGNVTPSEMVSLLQ